MRTTRTDVLFGASCAFDQPNTKELRNSTAQPSRQTNHFVEVCGGYGMALVHRTQCLTQSTRWMAHVIQEWASPQLRSRRVVYLLIAISLMSIGDLYMTLTHAMGPGFFEGNPIARTVMLSGKPMYVVWYKFLTAGTSMVLLFYCRRSQVGELAAWLGAVLLLWLMVQWLTYMQTIETVGFFSEWLTEEHGGTEFVAMVPAT